MSVLKTETGALQWWILFLAITVTTAACAIGGNRFPVISYQDRDDKGMKNDTFYYYLDSFGVSEFYTFNADTAGYWKEFYGHDIDYYFHHSRQHQWAYLDDDSLLHVWSAFKSAHCEMDAANVVEEWGYYQPLNTSVALSDNDNVVDTLVLKSLVSLHSPGFMHGAFTKGQFQYTSHRKQDDTTEVWDLIMAVDLRMPDTTAPDTVVVAQMVFENQKNYVSGSTWDQCDGEVSPYSVIRYNDSLILRWDGSAFDTFQVYDTSDVEAVISYCGDDVKSQALPSYFDSVCYLDGTTLYCTAPIKFVKDIWDTSFQNPNSYQTFTMSCIGKVGWAEKFDYKVYWTGAKDLYLYKLYFYDEKGFVFDSLTSNDLAGAQANLDAWYTDHTYASGNIKALRVVDEPAGPEFQNLDKFRQIVAGVSSGTPTEALGTLGSYNNSAASRYYDMYLRYGQVDKFHFDYYANLAYFSSSSQPNDTFNIQLMLNNYVSKYDIANTRARANNAAWQVILPTFDAWEKVDSVTYCKYRRMPTGNEIRAMANLALAYGARGIGYWPYISNVKPDKSPTSDLSVHERYLGTLPDTMPSGDFLPLASFDDPNACPPCSCTSVSEHDRNALVYDQTGLPYGIWWDVQDVNLYLDSMAYFFLNADWRSAGPASS